MTKVLNRSNLSLWIGLAAGVLYGVTARLLFAHGPFTDNFAIMSVSFVFLVPFALRSNYRIEQVSENQVILHLSSRHRLSTRFNFYAGLWTDFIMRDIQGNILRIIKNRSEVTPALTPPQVTIP